MQIGNLNANQVASSVWAAATRSLTVDPATSAGAGVQVWAGANRFLTSLVTNCFSTIFSHNQTLAAGISFTYQPAASNFADFTIAYKTDTNANAELGITDGTTNIKGYANGVSQQYMLRLTSINNLYIYLKNTAGSGTLTYSYTGWLYK